MHELYVWPFAEAVNAGVGSVMCSYNKVNQTQTCQNSKIISGILKVRSICLTSLTIVIV